jgi:hypothetical protein
MAIIGEIKTSSLASDSRFDSDYYIGDGADEREKIKHFGTRFSTLFPRVIHPAEFTRTYEPEGHLFLRAQNVKPGRIDVASQVFISDTLYEELVDAIIQTNDLLLVRTGANLGDLARVDSRYNGAVASSHTLRSYLVELHRYVR